MKQILSFNGPRLFISLFLAFFASNVYSQKNIDQWTSKQALQWVQKREWANNLKAMPHSTTDYREFASQYHKNKDVWDKTFQWLAAHDLLTIPEGRYEVAGEHCYINVQDAITQESGNRKIEAHRYAIDLQYVVKGAERFGITSAKYAEPITDYQPDVTFYKTKKIKYVDSSPDIFFLFFPKDYHQALVKAGEEPEKVRVIVAKIEYIL